MKGDFTRDTFDSFRHFSRVLMQQGRVQLDADFNEQAAILLHYLRTLATDLIGPYGGPEGNNLGFNISFLPNDGGNFTIGKGRYYVDGILCENDQDLKYLEQKYLKYLTTNQNKLLPANLGTCYAYLDVWERHITHGQTDGIREVALGGLDTCSRAQVVWQVKLKEFDAGTTCTSVKDDLPKPSNASIKARVRPEGEYENPCSIPPESRYRGLENQLYRIEIHRDGNEQEATFKWSRDNGSIVFPIVRQQGNVVTLQFFGRDKRTSLEQDDWVEITDDGTELRGEPGILAQVDKVDSVEMTVTLKLPSDQPPNSVSWPDYNEKSLSHPLLRRWDHRAIEGLKMTEGAILIHESKQSNDGWIEIENGIEVQFQPPDQGGLARDYRTGDYWLVPARVATGKIEWPPELDENGQVIKDSKGNELPKALQPHGIEHHYAPLAVIVNRAVEPDGDCRCRIKPPCP